MRRRLARDGHRFGERAKLERERLPHGLACAQLHALVLQGS